MHACYGLAPARSSACCLAWPRLAWPAQEPAGARASPLPPARSMPFIMKSRGLSRAIGMSQLLDTSPEIKVCGEGRRRWRAGPRPAGLRSCRGH